MEIAAKKYICGNGFAGIELDSPIGPDLNDPTLFDELSDLESEIAKVKGMCNGKGKSCPANCEVKKLHELVKKMMSQIK